MLVITTDALGHFKTGFAAHWEGVGDYPTLHTESPDYLLCLCDYKTGRVITVEWIGIILHQYWFKIFHTVLLGSTRGVVLYKCSCPLMHWTLSPLCGGNLTSYMVALQWRVLDPCTLSLALLTLDLWLLANPLLPFALPYGLHHNQCLDQYGT